MKKVLSTVSLLFLFTISHAQWKDGGTKLTTTQNVGIGTDSPIGTLHLHSATSSVLTMTYGGTGTAAIRSNNNVWVMGISGNSSIEEVSVGSQSGEGQRTLVLAAGGAARLKILANGNIGIGTNSPTQRLDINGNIKANSMYVNGTVYTNEVKVEATKWPDFVFDKDYKLRTLQEVENHINEHKHLPDIPSEKEVKENGLSLGEMQAKLLQKIEELTLYTIELNKTVKEQGELIQELRSKLE